MDAAAKRVAEGLFKAIQAEGDGHHFYRMAARSTTDPKGREVLEMLATEELGHKEFLSAQYKAVMETGNLDASVKLGTRAAFTGESPIFSERLLARVKEAHFEMSALSIGIQLELSAMQYYRSEAEEASDPQVKSFYNELAEWEKGHHEVLSRQQEALKEDYWSEAGFSPF